MNLMDLKKAVDDLEISILSNEKYWSNPPTPMEISKLYLEFYDEEGK